MRTSLLLAAILYSAPGAFAQDQAAPTILFGRVENQPALSATVSEFLMQPYIIPGFGYTPNPAQQYVPWMTYSEYQDYGIDPLDPAIRGVP